MESCRRKGAIVTSYDGDSGRITRIQNSSEFMAEVVTSQLFAVGGMGSAHVFPCLYEVRFLAKLTWKSPRFHQQQQRDVTSERLEFHLTLARAIPRERPSGHG
jgi:hypothetical protein